MIEVLRESALDGLPNGPAAAEQAEALLAQAREGNDAPLANAEQLLSATWIAYVEALNRPAGGTTYEDYWARPQLLSPTQILRRTASAQSLTDYVRSTSSVNPLYGALRQTEWAEMQSTGEPPDARVLVSLDRVRDAPAQDRFIIVDAAAARLYMIDRGSIVDSMRVVVGKTNASTQTPMLGSTIYYVTLKPYWHVRQR